MSRREWDPQYAPAFYVHVVRRMTDVDGVEIVLVEDQDGVRFVEDS